MNESIRAWVLMSMPLLAPLPPASLAAAPPAPPSAQRRPPALLIEYVAHASFLLTSRSGDTILVDPYASREWIDYDFPTGVEPDAVVITHPHYDHDAGFFRGAPFPWGPEVAVFDGPGQFRVGDFEVTGTRGKHADPYGHEFGQLNTIFVIDVEGIRLVHLGDNRVPTGENVRAMGDVDFLLMPIDAEYHILTRSEIDLILGIVEPRVVVPMHYRHPELETEPGSPDGLGPLEPWLEGREGVVRLDSNRLRVVPGRLPAPGSTVVFRTSPDIPRPRR